MKFKDMSYETLIELLIYNERKKKEAAEALLRRENIIYKIKIELKKEVR